MASTRQPALFEPVIVRPSAESVIVSMEPLSQVSVTVRPDRAYFPPPPPDQLIVWSESKSTVPCVARGWPG